MPIVGGFVFPHGTIPLDPETRDLSHVPAAKPTTKQDCLKLHGAMRKAAIHLVNLKPELIILSTPHGLRLQNAFLVVGNEMCSGSAEWDGDWKDFRADIAIDGAVSAKMVSSLRDAGNNVELLMVGAPTDTLPLRWGEVVPWWFMEQASKEASFQLPPAVIIGQPSKRIKDTQAMIPELTKFGHDIWEFIKTELPEKRIAIVISCDLSHYHSKDPTSPYHWDESAIPFDDFCVDWAKIDIDDTQTKPDSESNHKLVVSAGQLVNKIGSCGYTGLVTLQGILMACAGDSDTQVAQKFRAKLYAYAVPTYYGMMASSFT